MALAVGAFAVPVPAFCTAVARPHWLPGGAFAGSNMFGMMTCAGGTPGTYGNGLFFKLLALVNFLPQSLTSWTTTLSTSCIPGMSFAADAVASSSHVTGAPYREVNSKVATAPNSK